jgi:hypothetical protein
VTIFFTLNGFLLGEFFLEDFRNLIWKPKKRIFLINLYRILL